VSGEHRQFLQTSLFDVVACSNIYHDLLRILCRQGRIRTEKFGKIAGDNRAETGPALLSPAIFPNFSVRMRPCRHSIRSRLCATAVHTRKKSVSGEHRQFLQTSLGNPLLVPLTSSLYVPGKISDPEQVVIDIGTGYYVKKASLQVGCHEADGTLPDVVGFSSSISATHDRYFACACLSCPNEFVKCSTS
jgi:hypothetical protein